MAFKELVLVTGGSGFLATHCITALLRENYRVRTTLRSMNRADEVRDMIKRGGATQDQVNGIEFAPAELMTDDGWEEACKDCIYVLHVASPFPPKAPKNADELIVPAREGTLRALRAAKAAGTVKRVVVTSSSAAIMYGHPLQKELFSEKDWTNLDDPLVPAYQRSKTIAEKAAWDWIAKEGGSLELSVVNPVVILGPLLGKDFAASVMVIDYLVNGKTPGSPNVAFSIVDARDCAELHLKAMTDPKAAGQRFIATSDEEYLWIREVAASLKEQCGPIAKKVSTRVIPDFVLRIAGWFDASVSMVVPELNKPKPITNAKAKEVLGWKPRSAHEAIKASAESLSQLGLIK